VSVSTTGALFRITLPATRWRAAIAIHACSARRLICGASNATATDGCSNPSATIWVETARPALVLASCPWAHLLSARPKFPRRSHVCRKICRKDCRVMTNRETLRSLAEQVEALSGPCRETDALIWCALKGVRYVGHLALGDGLTQVEYREPPHNGRKVTGKSGVPHATPVTDSIDSAMSLVGYQCGRPHNVVIATGHGSAYIVPNDGASYGVNDDLCVRGRASGDDEIGRTARAITAASLRAIGEGL